MFLLFAGSIALLLFAGSAVFAQPFPSRGLTPVNDDAEIIDTETEARIVARLTEVSENAEVVIVTLLSTALYTGGDEIADYAENLFAQWEIGGTEGRGILLVVFQEDRELWIELGSAYGSEDEAAAQTVITDLIVPQFRDEAFGAGIEAGIIGLIDQIIVPAEVPVEVPAAPAPEAPAAPVTAVAVPAAGDAPTEDGGGGMWWIATIVGTPIALFVGLSRRRAAKLAATPCPSCGKTGLREERVTLDSATQWAAGRGETRTICPHCAHTTAVPFSIAKLNLPEKSKTNAAQPAVSSAAMERRGANTAPKGGTAGTSPKQAMATGSKPGVQSTGKPGVKPGGGGASGNW